MAVTGRSKGLWLPSGNVMTGIVFPVTVKWNGEIPGIKKAQSAPEIRFAAAGSQPGVRGLLFMASIVRMFAAALKQTMDIWTTESQKKNQAEA
jgi:hypothetical protein